MPDVPQLSDNEIEALAPEDTFKATTRQAVDFGDGRIRNTHSPVKGRVYEGRVNGTNATGDIFVSFKNPIDKTSLVPTAKVPKGRIAVKNPQFVQEGETMYVLILTDHAVPVSHGVTVVADEEDSTFAELERQRQAEPDPEPVTAAVADGNTDDDVAGLLFEDDDDTDEEPVDAPAADEEETDEPDEAVGATAVDDNVTVSGFICPICKREGVDDVYCGSLDAVRKHISNSEKGNHKGEFGSDATNMPTPIDSDGNELSVSDIVIDTGDGHDGSVSTEFVPTDFGDTALDQLIARIAMEYQDSNIRTISQFVRQDFEGEPPDISGKHIRWVISELPRLDAKSAGVEWASRGNVAKLYYYYGLSQTDIAERYDADQKTVSELMKSLEIGPGIANRYEDDVLDNLVRWGYDWADGLDTSADHGDPAGDPDIVPPLTTETDPVTMTDNDTDDTETTTIEKGNATYTGDKKGIDASMQTFNDRPFTPEDPDEEPEDDRELVRVPETETFDRDEFLSWLEVVVGDKVAEAVDENLPAQHDDPLAPEPEPEPEPETEIAPATEDPDYTTVHEDDREMVVEETKEMLDAIGSDYAKGRRSVLKALDLWREDEETDELE